MLFSSRLSRYVKQDGQRCNSNETPPTSSCLYTQINKG